MMPGSAARPRTGLAATLSAVALLAALAGCRPAPEPPAAEVRPVRVATVERRTAGDVVALTGTVQAEVETSYGFRIDGRLVARTVNVGDRVTAGQVIARLDPQNEENALRAARAAVSAAAAQLVEARNNYERQRELLATGFAPRARYDQAVQLLQTAISQTDSATAQALNAQNRLGYTQLVADTTGVVTARGAEPGEIVAAGRMVVQVARDDGRDAVFDVPARLKDQAPANPEITVTLQSDPAVTARGRVREVAPNADPVTGQFLVRVGLDQAPAGMRLGSTVVGRMTVGGGAAIEIPATALIRGDRQPAVWIVDPHAETVALRSVEVQRFDPARVLIARGLEPGEIIVTAGVQALRPGQKVRLLGAPVAAAAR